MRVIIKSVYIWGLFLLNLSGAALAEDTNHQFAIEGGGVASCEVFIKANQNKTRDFYVFAGWVEGYLTGFNQFTKDTYDITPWQTTELLMAALRKHCEADPSQQVLLAVNKMISTLYSERLTTMSKTVPLESEKNVMHLYETTMKKVQGALKTVGLYGGAVDGVYNDGTKKAITSFQKKYEMNQSGLPDQETLFRLFKNASE